MDCTTMCAVALVNTQDVLLSVRLPVSPAIPFISPALITHLDVPLNPPPIC